MAGGYGGFFPVTQPMEIPPEEVGSLYTPETPPLAELPEITDARTSGLRLQGTLAKALPGIPEAGSMTRERQREVEEYARDVGITFAESKAYERRSQAIARAKNRRSQTIAERSSKGVGRTGAKRTQYNARLANRAKINASQVLTGPSAFPYLYAIR